METFLFEYAQELLVSGLEHPDWPIRFAAAEALADLGDDRGKAILVEGLAATNTLVRSRALLSLGKCKDAALGHHFLQALTDPLPYIRGQALLALALSCGQDALEHIGRLAHDQDQEVQNSVLAALLSLEQAGEAMLEAIAQGHGYDCHYIVRLQAAFHLGVRNNPKGPQVLLETLECGDSWVAFLAARHLAFLQNPAGEPHLRQMLEVGNWEQKLAAIEGLIKLGVLESLSNKLYRHSDHPDIITRVDAIRVLDYFTPEETPGRLAQILDGKNEAGQIHAIEVIGALGKPELIRETTDILRQGPEHLRAKVILAIEKIGSPSLVVHLTPVLQKSHWLVQFLAARVALKLAKKC